MGTTETWQATKTPHASYGLKNGDLANVVNGGVVTSVTRNDEPVIATEYNEIGQVIQQLKVDDHNMVNATIEIKNTDTIPKACDQIAVGNTKYYLKKVEQIEENQGWLKLAIVAERFTNCESVVGGKTLQA